MYVFNSKTCTFQNKLQWYACVHVDALFVYTSAFDDFNNGVVLTSRILRPNELFEVRIDRMVNKWAGSIEIGVTTHLPTDLKFPCTMTNIFSGTWMMTGNGIMHNGTTVLEEYGQNLDSLQVSLLWIHFGSVLQNSFS